MDAIKFQRQSLTALIDEVAERGPAALGVIALVMDKDGHASFRISGFTGPLDRFVAAGMLQWCIADLMSDLT